MEVLQSDIEIVIENPKKISLKVIEMMEEENRNAQSLISKEGFFRDISKGVKLRLMYQSGYKEISEFLAASRAPEGDIKRLFEIFRGICVQISKNNILLAYSFVAEKKHACPILTKEDQKLRSLHLLYNGDISSKEFIDLFGHQGLNPFEIGERKYFEYRKNELLKVAEFTKNYEAREGVLVEDYLQEKVAGRYPLYCFLREELKDYALKVIKELRVQMLEIARKKKIEDIFGMSYDEVIRIG